MSKQPILCLKTDVLLVSLHFPTELTGISI
jgi:hypothetical protein